MLKNLKQYQLTALKHTYQLRSLNITLHAHNHITRTVAAMDSCFALACWGHQHGRVTKISLARVASRLHSTNKPVVKTNLFVDCRPLATLAGLILVTRHTMRSVNGSTAVWTSLFWNREADRARDESIASERSVGGIANRVNGHGTATSLLWISGGIEAGGDFPAELFASSDGHSGNHCSALSFP